MFTPDEARSILAFLDRAPINGHKERVVMNHLVNKIASCIPPAEKLPPEAGTAEPPSAPETPEEGHDLEDRHCQSDAEECAGDGNCEHCTEGGGDAKTGN